ncbi:MAG: hypothetical protein ACLRSW_13145 [Christensenellaceae bacterium]
MKTVEEICGNSRRTIGKTTPDNLRRLFTDSNEYNEGFLFERTRRYFARKLMFRRTCLAAQQRLKTLYEEEKDYTIED